MSKLLFLGKVFLLFISLAALFLLSTKAQDLRSIFARQLGISHTAIAGAQTSMEKEMREDVKAYAGEAKHQMMQMSVQDVIHSVARVKKIGEDVQDIKEYIVNAISNVKYPISNDK